MSGAGIVSIVVPFLNAERFLGEAVESVLAQTYGDWRLLLIDDGSSDRSRGIARDYASRFPERITYLAEPSGRPRGPARARNLGIAEANGDYIAFLDADDVWSPRKLERQTALLAAEPEAGMIYGASRWWYSWTGRPEDRERDHVENLGVPVGQILHPPTLLRPYFVLQRAAIPNPSSVVVRRSVTDAVGGFDESVPDGYEDQSLIAKVCVHASILASDECWDTYRQDTASLTAKMRSRGEEDAARARFLAWLIEYLRDQGVDGDVARALRWQRLRYAHPTAYRVARRVRRA
jgi:glycosyltransferase involved in cell wall biosynthesis